MSGTYRSAPTGSGKTTVFDLAFFRMIQTRQPGSHPYAIYLAPTKVRVGSELIGHQS